MIVRLPLFGLLLAAATMSEAPPQLAGQPVWDGPIASAPAPVQSAWSALDELRKSELPTQSQYTFGKSERALTAWAKATIGPWLDSREKRLAAVQTATVALDKSDPRQRVLSSGAMVAVTIVEGLKLADLLPVVLITRDKGLLQRVDAALEKNEEARKAAITACLTLPSEKSELVAAWYQYCSRAAEREKSLVKPSSAQRCADAALEPKGSWQVKALQAACSPP
jgi:hypothetical protein